MTLMNISMRRRRDNIHYYLLKIAEHRNPL